MDIYDILKGNLRELRLSNHLTQKELAAKLSIPRANLARYETGENVPPLDTLKKLAKFFEVTIDELVGEDR